MSNLGGHDLPTVLDAFDRIEHDRPTCFICYTIKGFGLPFAGHKDNHAGLMTPAQVESLRAAMNVRAGPRVGQVRGADASGGRAADVPRSRAVRRGRPRAVTTRRASRCRPSSPSASSRRCRRRPGFGALLNELGRGQSDFADRIVTTSPDVTVSTNLGPWVNRRGLFAREKLADLFKSERIPSTYNWDFSPAGPAHRARHRRDESVHPVVGARACRIRSTASGCSRSARCTIRSSRAVSMR